MRSDESIVRKMNLLCVLGRHRWSISETPGEEPYKWCQRCRRYKPTVVLPDPNQASYRQRPIGGGGGGVGGGGDFSL